VFAAPDRSSDRRLGGEDKDADALVEVNEALRLLAFGLGGSPGWAGRGAASKLAGCNFASSA
jgi:hypothetical protein